METHELEPKYRSEGDFEGNHSESMQFGGCYLGRHTGEINLIQQKYIEQGIITYEINRHLGESDQPVEIPEEQREGAVAELLKSFHTDAAFKKMDDGKYEVALDGKAVRGGRQEPADWLRARYPMLLRIERSVLPRKNGPLLVCGVERVMGIEPT